MFVLTAKLSKAKIAIAALIVLAIIAALILFVGGKDKASDAPVTVSSNDDRVTFLASFGWSVNAEPVQVQQVTIPGKEDSEVFERYNELQVSQGYDLTGYAGENAMRYVYEVLNYPDATAPVYATVLVHDGAVIGGDITGSAPDAPIHGFSMPS